MVVLKGSDRLKTSLLLLLLEELLALALLLLLLFSLCRCTPPVRSKFSYKSSFVILIITCILISLPLLPASRPFNHRSCYRSRPRHSCP